MFWGEPPRTAWDLNFSLLGIPVRVHPMFWVITILLGTRAPDLVSLLAWTAAVFVSILVHEMGHALAMRAYGFYPWVVLHGMGGLASYQQAGTYRALGHSTLGQVTITAAGPGAEFLLAVVVGALLTLTGHEVSIAWVLGFLPWPSTTDVVGSPAFTAFVDDLLFISVFWAAINLLPVYPLDGGQIAREVLVRTHPRDGVRLSLMLSIVTAIAMAVFAATQWESLYATLLFAYLAYASYAALQAYLGRGPF